MIAIEPGDDQHAFGVVVPDLPGCFSAGDTLAQAVENAKEAIALWLDSQASCATLPVMRPITEHMANPEFAGWTFVLVDVDLGAPE